MTTIFAIVHPHRSCTKVSRACSPAEHTVLALESGQAKVTAFSRPLYKVAGLSAALDAVSMPRCITRTPTVAVKAWPNPAENSHAFRRTLWHAAIRIGRLEADSN